MSKLKIEDYKFDDYAIEYAIEAVGANSIGIRINKTSNGVLFLNKKDIIALAKCQELTAEDLNNE